MPGSRGEGPPSGGSKTRSGFEQLLDLDVQTYKPLKRHPLGPYTKEQLVPIIKRRLPPNPQQNAATTPARPRVGFEALWDEAKNREWKTQTEARLKEQEESSRAFAAKLEALRKADRERKEELLKLTQRREAEEEALKQLNLRLQAELECMLQVAQNDYDAVLDYESVVLEKDAGEARAVEIYTEELWTDGKTPQATVATPPVTTVAAPTNTEELWRDLKTPTGESKVDRFAILRAQARMAAAEKYEEIRKEFEKEQHTLQEIEAALSLLEADAVAKDPRTEQLRRLQGTVAEKKATLSRMRDSGADFHVAADYLLLDGIELKGQMVYAFVTSGIGVGVDVSINPLGAVGINARIGGSLEGSKSKTRSLVAYRGPQYIRAATGDNPLTVQQPVVVHSLIGTTWALDGKFSAEISVGWEVRAGVGVERKKDESGRQETSVEADAKPESLAAADYERRHAKTMEFELAAIGVEAKAGVEANLGLSYETFYAEDPYPLYYSNTQLKQGQLRTQLALILQEGSTKTMLKGQACLLIQENSHLFPREDIALHTQYGIESILKTFFRPSIPTFSAAVYESYHEVYNQHVDQLRKSENFKKWDSFLSKVVTVSTAKVVDALSRHTERKPLVEHPAEHGRTVELIRLLRRFCPPSKGLVKREAHDFITANPQHFAKPSREFSAWMGLSEIATVDLVKILLEGRARLPESSPLEAHVNEHLRKLAAFASDSHATMETVHQCISLHHAIHRKESAVGADFSALLADEGKRITLCCSTPPPQLARINVKAISHCSLMDPFGVIPDSLQVEFQSAQTNKNLLDQYLRNVKSPCPDVKFMQQLIEEINEDMEFPVFLSITAHKGGGGAEVFATASADASLGGGTGARAEVRLGSGVFGSRKRSMVRFQTMNHATRMGQHRETFLITYDSCINYTQFSKGARLEVNASTAVLGKQHNLSDTASGKKFLEAVEKANGFMTTNRMTYRTTVAFWQKPTRSTNLQGTTPLKSGSGVSIGASFLVGNLRELYARPKASLTLSKQPAPDATTAQPPLTGLEFFRQCQAEIAASLKPGGSRSLRLQFLEAIVKSLELDSVGTTASTATQILMVFLADDEVRATIFNESRFTASDALLLEATYRVPPESTVDWVIKRSDKSPRRLVTLGEKAPEAMLAMKRTLGAIRLRFRRTDFQDRSENLFSLGLSANGTGFGIKLRRIEQAGHDAIIDLVTGFWRENSPGKWDFQWSNSQKTDADLHESETPPAPLFCQ